MRVALVSSLLFAFGFFGGQEKAWANAAVPASRLAEEAEAAGRAGDLGAALTKWQEAWERGQVGAFRLWVEARVAALVAPLAEPRLLVEAARLTSGSRIRALLEARRAELLVRAGREDQARALIHRTTAGLDPEERRALLARAGLPDSFGALVPLTGPLQGMGREILRGMLLAAGLVGRAVGAAATVVVRDSEGDILAGARALARSGVLAILGVPRSARARQVAPLCQAEGVPLVTGADGHRVPELGSYVFRGVHAPAVRARALASWLASHRPKARVAVVHPESLYGRRTAEAFVTEAKRLGLDLVGTVAYLSTESNLYPRLGPLAAHRPQAVFVADGALRLEIVAPQLALAGLGPAPQADKAPRRRRGATEPIQLLSTAEGLRGRLVKNVAQAVEGSVLAPGFFPDPQDPALSAFVTAFGQAYGHPPGRYAALGYLWVLELRSLMVSRARGRVSLRAALATARGPGGARIFDDQGDRVDPPRLYQVRRGVISRMALPRAPGGARP